MNLLIALFGSSSKFIFFFYLFFIICKGHTHTYSQLVNNRGGDFTNRVWLRLFKSMQIRFAAARIINYSVETSVTKRKRERKTQQRGAKRTSRRCCCCCSLASYSPLYFEISLVILAARGNTLRRTICSARAIINLNITFYIHILYTQRLLCAILFIIFCFPQKMICILNLQFLS